MATDPEQARLDEDGRRQRNWKRWGPYLSERQWGTVREDYSPDGDLLGLLPARPRAQPRLPLGRGRPARHHRSRMSPLLRARPLERARPHPQGAAVRPHRARKGNHGEDVKECYYYLDSTPTHSYLKALYKYPQRAFPYERARRRERRARPRTSREFELTDTGVFDENRYFDVFAEYAKAAPDDMLIRITVTNRGPDAAPLHLLPTLWFRNTWSLGREGRGHVRASMHIRAMSFARSTPRSASFASSSIGAKAAGSRAPLHRERDER